MSKKDKKKAELLLPAFDAHLFSAGYTPECEGKSRCVFLLSQLWDEEKQRHISAHLEFRDVAAMEWVLNVPQDGIGSDVGGLYELFGKKKKTALLERVFRRRKSLWLLSGDYQYDEEDPYDSLNSRVDLDELEERKNLKPYRLFLLQKEGGGALILAKEYEFREIPEQCR